MQFAFILSIFFSMIQPGHAGHDEPPDSSLRKVPLLRGNENKYNLDAQIKHKVIKRLFSQVPKLFINPDIHCS